MCGICGWLDVRKGIDAKRLEQMNNIAKHRGPDDEGYFLVERGRRISFAGQDTCQMKNPIEYIGDYQGQAFLGMAHRRLSIIDLSEAGHQPMCDEESELYVTFNGEIYNYIEVKEQLRGLGYCFVSNSDTEVLLKAYREWGEDCVHHFNGMWAFALWDEKKRNLFCSRDRLGAKPFHYYKGKDCFMFSSEMKQLCENPMIPRKLNQKVMTSQVMWGITDYSEESLIEDIRVLPGGCNLVLHLNEERTEICDFRIDQYWDIRKEQMGTESIEDSDIFDVLKNAIEIRTRSDVPIGVLLSGGLDSSCLVSEVSRLYCQQGKDPKELNTYTSCYERFREGDEREFAKVVNEHCGTEQNFIYPDEKDTFSLLEKMVWHMEGNSGFSTMGSFMTLEKISEMGAKVLLNGQGSDETMFGYERYYAFYFKQLLKEGKVKELISEYKKAANNSRLTLLALLQYSIYFNIPIVRKNRVKNRMGKYVSNKVHKTFHADKDVNQYLFFSSLNELQYNELRKTQLTHILRMDDRAYMAFSMESRVPFIDYRYMEKAVKIRPEEKIEKGYTKYLLRKFMEGKLPDSIVWRKNKMGWPSPKERWVSRFDEEKVADLFDNARTKDYFNIEELKNLYKKSPASYPIERFMFVELFVRLFDVQC